MGVLSFGYGCYIDKLRLKEGYEKELEKLFPKQIRDEFEEDWELDKGYITDRDEYLKLFVDDYCAPSGETGLDVLIADIINCRSFNEKKVIRGEELVLYAIPLFPKTEEERAKMPLLSDIEKAMREVLDPIAENPDEIELGYCYFEEL